MSPSKGSTLEKKTDLESIKSKYCLIRLNLNGIKKSKLLSETFRKHALINFTKSAELQKLQFYEVFSFFKTSKLIFLNQNCQ